MSNPAEVLEFGLATRHAKAAVEAGNFDQAARFWRAAVAAAKTRFGGESNQTQFSSEELASSLEKLGRWAEAAFHWSVAFSLSKTRNGELSECTASIARRAAMACMQLRQRKRAIPYWQSALAGSRMHYGAFNRTTLFCIKHYARCLAAERQYTQVLEMTVPVCHAFNRREKQMPSKLVASIFQSTAQALTALGRHGEASAHWRTYSMFCSAEYGECHPVSLNALREWASSLGKAGRVQEALTLLTRCVDLSRELHGPEHNITTEIVGFQKRLQKQLPDETAAA